MDKKTFQELWENDELEEVDETIDDSWRHGNNMTTVFKHTCEDTGEETFWEAHYRVSGDGEYHGIREVSWTDKEGKEYFEFELNQVWPHKKIIEVTKWLQHP